MAAGTSFNELAQEWLARVRETMRDELRFKGGPEELRDYVLPILAGLGFDFPHRAELGIEPRLKRNKEQ